jgi:hypothetical protein
VQDRSYLLDADVQVRVYDTDPAGEPEKITGFGKYNYASIAALSAVLQVPKSLYRKGCCFMACNGERAPIKSIEHVGSPKNWYVRRQGSKSNVLEKSSNVRIYRDRQERGNISVLPT